MWGVTFSRQLSELVSLFWSDVNIHEEVLDLPIEVLADLLGAGSRQRRAAVGKG